MPVTAQESNDTKKYGPYGEFCFFLMRRDTVEPVQEDLSVRHASPFYIAPAGRTASRWKWVPGPGGARLQKVVAQFERPPVAQAQALRG